MNSYKLKIADPINLELKVKRAPNIALYFLLSVAVIIFFVPPLALIFLIIPEGEGISFTFLIPWSIALFVSIYLFRLYLWNGYGKEVFIVGKRTIIHYYDYKFFKDNKREMDFKNLEVYFSSRKGVLVSVNESYGKLPLSSSIYFCSNENIIESKIELPTADIIKVGRAIKNKRP
ncbi:MAG: hypothetical protein ACK5M3_17800 [Dysgonomonas sp.]